MKTPWGLKGRIDRTLRKDVQVAPVDRFIRSAMVSEGWLGDEETNYLLGYGRGVEGRLEATRQIAASLDPASPAEAFGIFEDGDPVGLALVSPTVSRRRSREFFLLVRPESRGKGIAAAAFAQIADKVFLGTETRRLEVELLAENKGAIGWLRHEGMSAEGRRVNGWWTPDGMAHTTILMRLLSKEWTKWGRGREGETVDENPNAGGGKWLREPGGVESTQESEEVA